MHINAKDMIESGVSEFQSVQLTSLVFNKFKNPKTSRNIDLNSNKGMLEAWQIAVKEIFPDPELNKLTDHQRDIFAQYMYKAVYQNWDKEKFGNPPTYIPDQEKLKNTNEAILVKHFGVSGVDALHELSITPGKQRGFYAKVFKILGFGDKKNYKNNFELTEDTVVKVNAPDEHRWLDGAEMNMADIMLRNNNPDAVMIKYQRGNSEIVETTYGEMDKLSNKIANGLTSQDFKKGDVMLTYMPMSNDSMAMFLGAMKAGITLINLSDSFTPEHVDNMLADYTGRVKGVLTQDTHFGGKEHPIYEKLLQSKLMQDKDIKVIVRSKNGLESDAKINAANRPNDVSLKNLIDGQSDTFTSATMSPEDTIFILGSSGTTGPSKLIGWKACTFIKSAMDAMLHFNLKTGDTTSWLTSHGWMMGSHEMAAAFINKATIGIFEGDITDKSKAYGNFLQNAEVSNWGGTPTHFSMLKKSGVLDGADLRKIKAIKNTGEKSNPVTMFWIQARAGFRKLIEYMGGTEIGGGYLSNSFHKASSPCEFDMVSYGLNMFVHKDVVPHPTDKEAENIFEAGEVAIVMNRGYKNSGFLAPIGLSEVLFNKSFKHAKKYPLVDFLLENGKSLLLRRHGDGVSLLPNGNFRSDGRMDGAININGIKTSRVELENAIKDHLQKDENSQISKDFVRVAVYDVPNPQGGENKVIVQVEMNNPENHRNLEQMKKVFGNAFANINPGFKSAVADVVVAPVAVTASAKTQHKIMIQDYMDRHYGDRLVAGSI
jgi:acetyl-CoA synthetase